MGAAEAPRANPWWVLAGACTGLFVLMLDSTVVVLALPAIHRDLDASLDGLQWVQNAYLLTLAATVVSAGRLGDILGRRVVFISGMVAFALGSMLSGLADDESVLVVGRVIQGLGGSALLALSLALTTHAFPAERVPRALGIWAAVSAIALALGPLVGGVLIEAASWRWIFFINIPVAVAGIAILLARGEESRDASASRIDRAGVLVLAVGLIAVVFALVEADDWGWDSARTLGLLAGGLAVLAGFWRIEHRIEAPLVDFSLFRNRPYLGATAAAFALVGAYWVVMFFQPQYLQEQLGYSAIEAGALILPVTMPMAVFSPLSGGLIARLGPRTTMTAGMLIGVAGLVWQATAEDTSTYGRLLPGFLCFGIALALVYAPMSTAAMAAMPDSKAGIASGVLAMNRVLAGALLLAVAGAVFQSQLAGATASAAAEYADAVSVALWPAIVVVAIGTLLTWLLVRAPSAEHPRPPGNEQHHQHHRRFHL
jgi:EmrB/QacA subfamily drug resistance transporter